MLLHCKGRNTFDGEKEKQGSPKINKSRLSGSINSYSLPPEEIEKIFKNVKPQTPPSMLAVGMLKRKVKK